MSAVQKDLVSVVFSNTGIYANSISKENTGLVTKTFYQSYKWGPVFDLYNTSVLSSENIIDSEKDNAYITRINTYLDAYKTKQLEYSIKEYSKIIKHAKLFNINNDFNKRALQFVNMFTQPIIIVKADFFALKIIQAIPVNVGLKVKWDVKEINIHFNDMSSFVSKVVDKAEAFLGSKISEEEVTNLLFNYYNFRTAKISDPLLQDILRGVYMELFIQTLKHVKIPDLESGLLFITGDYPAVMVDNRQVLLSLIDGLVLKGLWGIYIDMSYKLLSVITNMTHIKKMDSAHVLNILGSLDIFFHPVYAEPTEDVLIVNINSIKQAKNKKFIGLSRKLSRLNSKDIDGLHVFSDYNGIDYELVLPVATKIRSVIIDDRRRPIEYGPGPINNIGSITKYLNNLSLK